MIAFVRGRGFPLRDSVVPAVLAVLAVVGCETAPGRAPPPVRATLDEVFATEGVIQLGEHPQDSISVPGIFAERPHGGFLVTDGHLPRVRSYDEQGRLEAAFGRFGEGPFEFRGISDVTATPSGRVVVVDPRQDRLTYLTSDLLPDRMVRLPGVAYGAESLGEDLLLEMTLAAERAEDLSRFIRRPVRFHRLTGSGVAWSAYPLPFVPAERPYWRSFVEFPFAVAGDSIFVASSLEYPVTILNASGDSVGELGAPSGTYKPFPILESGALSPGAYATQLPELLGGSNTISHLAVVGSRLVLTHGRFGYPSSSNSVSAFGAYHASLDIYDRHTGLKLYEDIPLPEGSRVLGGGRFLYVLQDRGFPPWRISKLSFREPPPDG